MTGVWPAESGGRAGAVRHTVASMRLVTPTTGLHRSYLAAVDEFAGAHRDGDGTWTWIDEAGEQHVYTRAEMESDAGFAHFIGRRTDPDRPIPTGWVPCTFYWMEHDGEYVGSVMIRHELNDFLRHEGGHIGYSVRPSARRRGHATEALRQSLAVCRGLGIERALVTCDDDNVGSATVIETNGGVLENRVRSEREDKLVRRYWIDTRLGSPHARLPDPPGPARGRAAHPATGA